MQVWIKMLKRRGLRQACSQWIWWWGCRITEESAWCCEGCVLEAIWLMDQKLTTKSHHLDWRLQSKAYRKQEKHWSLRLPSLAGPLACWPAGKRRTCSWWSCQMFTSLFTGYSAIDVESENSYSLDSWLASLKVDSYRLGNQSLNFGNRFKAFFFSWTSTSRSKWRTRRNAQTMQPANYSGPVWPKTPRLTLDLIDRKGHQWTISSWYQLVHGSVLAIFHRSLATPHEAWKVFKPVYRKEGLEPSLCCFRQREGSAAMHTSRCYRWFSYDAFIHSAGIMEECSAYSTIRNESRFRWHELLVDQKGWALLFLGESTSAAHRAVLLWNQCPDFQRGCVHQVTPIY